MTSYGDGGVIDKDQAEKLTDLKSEDLSPEQRKVRRWTSEIRKTQQNFKDWHARCQKIIKRYRDEVDDQYKPNHNTVDPGRKYNVFWSIIQTVKPHLYMEPPKPYVHRKFHGDDDAARDAATLMQRLLINSCEEDKLHYSFSSCVHDYQLLGRGVTWVVYKPFFKLRTSVEKMHYTSKKELPEADDSYELGEDEKGTFYKPKYRAKVYEQCEVSHVLYDDFLHEMSATWEHCGWVARRVPMKHSDLVKRFGREVAEAVPKRVMDKQSAGEKDKGASHSDDKKGLLKRAEVWEIWDRTNREVIWLCPDYVDSVLDEKKDIYGLEGFYPCAKPLYATLTTDSLIPIPDFAVIQGLLNEIDTITQRIALLVESMRIAGCYNAEYPHLQRIVKHTRENVLIPVEDYVHFAEQGGLKGAIDFLPLSDTSAVIEKLHAHRRSLMQELYEITGVSDVIRGASDYRETARAQQIKGDFASMRLRGQQYDVAMHVREVLQIKAELIARHYSDDQIRIATNAQALFTQQFATPEGSVINIFNEERFKKAVQVLRDDFSRHFRIKIDTETLGGMKREEETQKRTEFLTTIGNYMKEAVAASESAPNTGPLLAKALMFAIRGFPVGRTLEADFEETLEKLIREGTGKQPEQQGKSPQELQIEQAKLQLEQQRVQLEMQKLQIDAQRMQSEAQEKFGRLQLDSTSRERDSQSRNLKMQLDAQVKGQQIQVQRDAALMNREAAQGAQNMQFSKLIMEAQKEAEAKTDRAEEREFQEEENEKDRDLEITKTLVAAQKNEQKERDNGENI